MRVLILGTLCGLWVSTAANAVEQTISLPKTVQDLRDQCKSDNAINSISCINYLWGMLDGLQVVGVMYMDKQTRADRHAPLAPFAACPPFVTGGQIQQVFIKWADDNPKDWQQPKEFGAWVALQRAWPCIAKN